MTSEAGAMTPGTTVSAKSLVLDYGVSGNGFVETTAVDGAYGANSPYQQTVSWATHPATGQTVRTRTGNLYGLFAQANEYGLYAGNGTADTDPYLRISSNSVRLNNIPLRLHNSGVQTVNIDSAGTDIWVGPSSADKRLHWNGTTLSVVGSITITGGNAAKTDFSNITATIDNVPNGTGFHRTTPDQVTGAGRAFTALSSGNNLVTSVIPATAIGNPGTAGLYLGSDYMGYHTGSGTAAGWKTYMDSSGNMRLAGNASNNYIQWVAASNKLQGVGGGVEQWYADATDGKLYAGAGAVWLDVDGLTLLGDSTATHSGQSSTRAVQFERSNGALIGRLTSYYLSGGDDYGLDIYARSPNTEDTFATFGAEQAGTTYGGGAAGAPRLVAYSSAAGNDYLRLYANTEIALYRTGSASADLTLNSAGLTSYVDLDMNGYDITGVGSLSTSNGYTLSAGGISAGNIGVDYSPTSGNWGTSGSTLLLNGLDHTTIGFHDSNNRVDFIRVGAGLITLGYNGGFGAANVAIGGTVRTAAGVQWDLGGYTGGAPTATGYVTVVINGVTYKLLAST
jgi:hypothetical protein